MKAIWAVPIIASILILGVIGLSEDAHAISGTISDQASCEALGFGWFAPKNECSLFNQGLIISPGETLTISNGIRFFIHSLPDSFASSTIFSGGTLINHGAIEISGPRFQNLGTIINELDGTINYEGEAFFNKEFINSGKITNRGIITTEFFDSRLTNDSSGIILNFGGTINILSGTTLVNSGTINNNPDGIINNSGTIEGFGTINSVGIINNSGDIKQVTIFSQGGTFNNNAGATLTTFLFTNGGTFNNNAGAIINNFGIFSNGGELINDGNINNPGTFKHSINSSTYSGSGTINGVISLINTTFNNIDLSLLGYPNTITTFAISSGDQLQFFFPASFTIPSGFTLINNGELLIRESASMTNSGTIVNEKGSTLTIKNSGTLTNFGTIILEPGLFPLAGGAIINDLGTIINSGLIKHVLDPRLPTYSGTGTFTNTGSGQVALTGESFSPLDLSLFGYPSTMTTFNILSGDTLLVFQRGLTIPNGYTFINSGTLHTIGPIINSGVINNSGGLIDNSSGGIINNSGTINNSGGRINNFATINNSGIINNIGGLIENSGTINNSCTGTITGIITGEDVEEEPCGTITIIKNTIPDDATPFAFIDDIAAPNSFTLDDDGDNANTLSNTKTFASVSVGSHTVTETANAAYTTSVDCDDADSTQTSVTQTATINLQDDETVICTFTNEPLPLNPDIHLIATGQFQDENNNGFADVGETVSLGYEVTNTGDVSLDNVVLSDNKAANLSLQSGDTNNDSILDLDETWLYTGSYVVTQADIDAGQVEFLSTVTADDPSNQEVSDNDNHIEPLPQVETGTITIIKNTIPDDATPFAFTDDIAAPNSFTLDDDGNIANTFSNTKTFNSVPVGSHTVTETANAAYTTTVDCNDVDSTQTSVTQTATINLQNDETVICTFTNELNPPAITDCDGEDATIFKKFPGDDTSNTFFVDGVEVEMARWDKNESGTIEANEGWIIKGTGNKKNAVGDVVVGTDKDDLIKPGWGNDRVCARAGDDLVQGGQGADRLFGEDGDDLLKGGKGGDFLVGGEDTDEAQGGKGSDTCDAETVSSC